MKKALGAIVVEEFWFRIEEVRLEEGKFHLVGRSVLGPMPALEWAPRRVRVYGRDQRLVMTAEDLEIGWPASDTVTVILPIGMDAVTFCGV